MTKRTLKKITCLEELENLSGGDLVRVYLEDKGIEATYEGQINGRDSFMQIEAAQHLSADRPQILIWRCPREYVQFLNGVGREGIKLHPEHLEITVYQPHQTSDYDHKLNLVNGLVD